MITEGTIPGVFLNRAASLKEKIALKYKQRGRYRGITWAEFGKRVRKAALGLISVGVRPGDRVALLSENRPEWAICDLAILSSGAVSVPIYTSDTPKEIEYIIQNSEAEFLVVSTQEQLAKVDQVLERLEKLGKIVVLDEIETESLRCLTFSKLLQLGEELDKEKPNLFEERVAGLKKDDLASIIYTSGTTGPPKGVMLSHDNFLSNCRSGSRAMPVSEKDTYLSFLPLSHVFERIVGYMFIFLGATIAYVENLNTIPQNILEISPTVMCAVPRFYEKMYLQVQEAINQAPAINRKFFLWCIDVGKRYTQASLAKQPLGLCLKFQHAVASALAFKKLRKRLGGRVRFLICGGAPLAKEIAEFFHAVGVVILEGYGLTETAPVITVNRVDKFKFGTVGQPLPGVEVKIASDGEILVKGPNVMKGYYKNDEATQEALEGGWLHTGDIGSLDSENFLVITDRKKDIIITSGGKNIAPQNIENLLKVDRYISEVMVYGDRKKYLTALIVPDFDRIAEFAAKGRIPFISPSDLVKNPKIYALLEERINEKLIHLANYEQIKKFVILDRAFTQEAGELTPTLKVRRKFVSQKYKDVLDALYD